MAKQKRVLHASHSGIQNFLKTHNYQFPFTIDASYIDCKEMSRNYENSLIPLQDIADAITAVTGPWHGKTIHIPGLDNLTVRFEMIPVSVVRVHPAFQRDVSPNHSKKIEVNWTPQVALVAVGLRLPEKYGGIVLNPDSQHTNCNRIRSGDTHLPFWVADIPDQGSYDETLKYALKMAGFIFLMLNVDMKRGVDIFDQHHIKVCCNIYPAPQIQNVIDCTKAFVKRAGNKITNAIHNLNEVYNTFELDAKTSRPGLLLENAINWHIRNFPHQSIDGCLMSSFALLIHENEKIGIVWTQDIEDTLGRHLSKTYTTSNAAQDFIKKSYMYWDEKGKSLHPNYIVKSGLQKICSNIGIQCSPDGIGLWKKETI